MEAKYETDHINNKIESHERQIEHHTNQLRSIDNLLVVRERQIKELDEKMLKAHRKFNDEICRLDHHIESIDHKVNKNLASMESTVFQNTKKVESFEI